MVPVGVMLDGDVLRISTPSDTFKVRNLRADPHVAVCVADPQDARHYVEVRGTAELADDVDRSFIDWMTRDAWAPTSTPTSRGTSAAPSSRCTRPGSPCPSCTDRRRRTERSAANHRVDQRGHAGRRRSPGGLRSYPTSG